MSFAVFEGVAVGGAIGFYWSLTQFPLQARPFLTKGGPWIGCGLPVSPPWHAMSTFAPATQKESAAKVLIAWLRSLSISKPLPNPLIRYEK